MTTKRPLSILVLALIVAAIAAPAASAGPVDPLGVPEYTSVNATMHQADQPAPVAAQVDSSGFDWGDAGIGAGATVALLAMGLGGVLVVSTRRHSQQRSAATS